MAWDPGEKAQNERYNLDAPLDRFSGRYYFGARLKPGIPGVPDIRFQRFGPRNMVLRRKVLEERDNAYDRQSEVVQ